MQIPHNRLTFGKEEVQAVTKVVSSGHWAGGFYLKELENALTQRVQSTYAVGVASGSAALRLVLQGVGVKPGDEVIVPAYSCVALANAVMALGANPIPVDILPCDWNLDPHSVRIAITQHTRAIVIVNTFGTPAPIEDLHEFNLPLIEDCSHGFGIKVGGSFLGNRSDAAILSFYATKLIGGGEGGAVITNKPNLAKFVCEWRNYADKPPDGLRFNDKMNDLEAALALCQLERLDSILTARKQIAHNYYDCLAPVANNTGRFTLPNLDQNRIWYRYVVEIKSVPASVVIKQLQKKGIDAESPICDWRVKNHQNSPVANRAYEQLVSLPIYPTLQPEELEIVSEALISVIEELSDG